MHVSQALLVVCKDDVSSLSLETRHPASMDHALLRQAIDRHGGKQESSCFATPKQGTVLGYLVRFKAP